jgi:hypothetical protein
VQESGRRRGGAQRRRLQEPAAAHGREMTRHVFPPGCWRARLTLVPAGFYIILTHAGLTRIASEHASPSDLDRQAVGRT